MSDSKQAQYIQIDSKMQAGSRKNKFIVIYHEI
jgi:hypothetical protein